MIASKKIGMKTDGTAIYHTAAAPVTIGDNVWIGGSCIVFPAFPSVIIRRSAQAQSSQKHPG
ncbi:MAG: hypothetical protein R3C26_07780 [Calditrichia bacterium]